MKPQPVPKRFTGTALIALVIALIVTQWVPSSFADTHVGSDLSRGPWHRASLNSLSVFGDFDGDQRLDQAELHLAGSHHCIRVRFGNSRESHFVFRLPAQVRGTLLTRDVNHDGKPDLIWIFHYQLPAVVWLGDGLGHFDNASGTSGDDGLTALLSGYPDPQLVGDSEGDHLYLTPGSASTGPPRADNLEAEIHQVLLFASGNARRDLGLYLSYLRERGPPSHLSFA